MRAIVVAEYGGPEVLTLRELDPPDPGPGEVTIDVAFAGVNFTDVRNRVGDGLGVVPFVPGVEVAGTVRALGDGVEGLRVGQPVAALTRGSSYAEVARAAAVFTVPLPDRLVGRPESGGMLVALPTALLLLRQVARVQSGETVLVHSAAGGVGTVVGQLAARFGVRALFGTVGSREKVPLARKYGYTDVFGYEEFTDRVMEATNGVGVDVVLDPIGGDIRSRSFELLAPFGRLATYSNISREPEAAPDADWLRARCVGYLGLSAGQLSARFPEAVRPGLLEATRLVADGHIDLAVSRVLPLAEAARAHEEFQRRAAVGKLILQVGGAAGGGGGRAD